MYDFKLTIVKFFNCLTCIAKTKRGYMSYVISTKLDGKHSYYPENQARNTVNNELTFKIETLANLLNLVPQDWESRNNEILNDKIHQFYEKFGRTLAKPNSPGFLEKHVLLEGSTLAVIGDIHGNDTRLVKTLEHLKKQGYIDDAYRCMPGRFLIFLGDYVDRGVNSLKVVELLITLKNENPTQVFLVRGNHEDLNTSKERLEVYASQDLRYRQYMEDEENQNSIDLFYQSLPSVVYLGQKAKEGEKTQYIHYSHASFYLFTDPAPLLDSERLDDYCSFDFAKDFSPRLVELSQSESTSEKKRGAIKKLMAFKTKTVAKFDDVYWNDIGKQFKHSCKSGRTTLPIDIVHAYLIASGTSKASVKRIIRGHQLGGLWAMQNEGKLVAMTLDPSGDESSQIFVELKLSEKVNNYIARSVSFSLD